MSGSLLVRVARAMGEIAPLPLADRSWDNVGVLVESPDPNKHNTVLITIDLTPEVMEECLRKKAEVVVAYHPPIFSSFKRLTLHDPKQRIILQCIRAGISIYSPHTSLDATEGGINDWLADLVDPQGTRTPIQPVALDPNARPTSRESVPAGRVGSVPPDAVATGMGRVVRMSTPKPMDQLVAAIKEGLGMSAVHVSIPTNWQRSHAVSSVALCAGSGASVFRQLRQSVDVLFTGELGHHDVLAANAAGQAVIVCGHTNTERGYLAGRLAPRLKGLLGPEVAVEVSDADRDPLSIW